MARILRWILIIIAILISLFVVALLYVYIASNSRINKTYDIKPKDLKLPQAGRSVKRGQHLVEAIGKCGDCHGDNLGGKVMADNPLFGRLVASNLTRGKGGTASEHDEEDLVLIMRHGIDPHDNQSVLFMPSNEFYYLSDRDLGDIIAYLETVPPVNKKLPELRIGPLARLLLLQGNLPLLPAELIDHEAKRPKPPKIGVTKEYGEYLANIGGCKGCLGHDLSGGPIPGTPPGTPPATNLTKGGEIKNWTETDFFRAMRQGREPDGDKIDPFMPWKATKKMTNAETRAVWLYLRSLP